MTLAKRRTSDGVPGLDATTYRRLIDLAPDAVVVTDSGGRIVLINDQTQRLFGYRSDELIGRPVEVLIPARLRGGHLDHRRAYQAHPTARPMGAGRELAALRKDGSEFAAEISLSPVTANEGTLFATVIRDISERRRAEQELKLLKNLALVISVAPDWARAMSTALETVCQAAGWDYGNCWIPRADGSAMQPGAVWRRSGAGVDKVRPEHDAVPRGEQGGLVGRVWDSGRPEVVPDIRTLDGAALVGSTPDGRPRLRGAVSVPILSGADVVAVMCFMSRDPMPEDRRLAEVVCAAVAPLGPVLQQKRAEDELQHHRQHLQELVAERTEQLEATHEQLRQADRLAVMGTLAAGLGHDMNNVLFPVRCRLDTMERALQEGKWNSDAADGVRTIRQSVEYLQRLSDGLHLLALDPRDPEASGQATDPSEWWEQVEPILRKAVGKHAEFKADVPRTLPAIGVAPHRLTQAVLNLIVNASDAVAASARQGLVRVSLASMGDGRFVRLTVEDTGCGMSEEVRRRAQDPFFTTKKRGLGTGLGLPLVRGTVQSAGGSLNIESALGKGTSVILMLPIAERASDPPSGAVMTASASVSDPRLASMLQVFLAGSGFEVHAAGGHGPPDTLLWVTGCPPATVEAMRRFLAGDSRRRLLVLGRAAPEVSDRVIHVRDADDFEAIREGVALAARAVTGATG